MDHIATGPGSQIEARKRDLGKLEPKVCNFSFTFLHVFSLLGTVPRRNVKLKFIFLFMTSSSALLPLVVIGFDVVCYLVYFLEIRPIWHVLRGEFC